MTALTRREAECLSFLKTYAGEHGYSPNYDEIAAHLELAGRSSVAHLIERLEKRGAIRRRPGAARSIEIIKDQGAEFHLKRILNAVACTDFVGQSDPIISAAQEYSRGRA